MPDAQPGSADFTDGVSEEVRSAARGGVSLAVGQVLSRLAQLGFVLAVTRLETPEEFGRYSLATALLVFGGFVADFGTTRLIVKTVSRDAQAADAILSGTLGASAALGVFGWAGITAVAAITYDATAAIDAAIIGASLPMSAAATSLTGACEGVGRFGSRTVATTLQTFIAAVGGALAVWIADDIRAALVLVPVGAAAALISASRSVQRAGLIRSKLAVDLARTRWLLRGSVPFALFAGLGAASGRFDVILLSSVDGAKAAAEYDVALRAVEALWYFHSLLTAPALFLLSRRIASRNVVATQRAYGEAVRLSYLVGLFFTAIFVGLHGPLADALGGGAYTGTGIALSIIGLGTWLSLVGLTQGALLLASDQLRFGLRVAGAITGVTIALDIALIPAFGLIGASVAATAAAAITVLGFGWFAFRAEGLRTPRPPVGSIAAAMLATLTAWTLREEPFLAAPATALVYALLLVLTRAVQRNDALRFAQALRRSSGPLAGFDDQ